MNEEIPPNCVFVKVDVTVWKSYIVFSDSNQFVAFEFQIDEFGEKGDVIADAIHKGADVSRVMSEMKADGKTIDDMDACLVALSADGGL